MKGIKNYKNMPQEELLISLLNQSKALLNFAAVNLRMQKQKRLKKF